MSYNFDNYEPIYVHVFTFQNSEFNLEFSKEFILFLYTKIHIMYKLRLVLNPLFLLAGAASFNEKVLQGLRWL
jgi:hypothetical protein